MAPRHAAPRREPAAGERRGTAAAVRSAAPAPSPGVASLLQRRLGNQGTQAALAGRLSPAGAAAARTAVEAQPTARVYGTAASQAPARASAAAVAPAAPQPRSEPPTATSETTPPETAAEARSVVAGAAEAAPAGPREVAAPSAPTGAEAPGAPGMGKEPGPAPRSEAAAAAGPPVQADDAAALLASLAQVPASQFGKFVEQAKVAAEVIQVQQKAELEASLPETERPTGLPRAAERVVPAPTVLPRGTAPEMPGGGPRQGQVPDDAIETGPIPFAESTMSVEEPAGEVEGGWWNWLVGRVRQFLGGIPTSDPGLSTSAGPRPRLDLGGEADPSRIAAHQQISREVVGGHRALADAAVSADFGESAIYPTVPAGTVRSSYKVTPPNKPSSRPATPVLPTDLRTAFDESAADAVRARVTNVVAQYRTEEAAYQEQSQQARQDVQLQLEEASSGVRAEQQAIQQQARSEVDGGRVRWRVENAQIDQRFAAQADATRAQTDAQIETTARATEEKVETTLTEAETKAAAVRADAERRATEQKREVEARPRSWWDRVKGFINDVFDRVKTAVAETFKAARSAVRQAIEGAKRIGRAIIETARLAVVGLVRALGVALKGLVTIVLMAFPDTAARARKWIDGKVDGAVAAVNKAADWLKKKYEELYDWFGRILDSLLNILQIACNVGLELLRLFATGEIYELMKKIHTLAGALWDGLGMVEGEIYRELLGFDLTKNLGPQLMGGGEEANIAHETEGGDPANIRLLLQDRIRDDQVEVSPVPELEVDEKLLEQFDLGDGDARLLDLSNDPERGVEAAIRELLEPLAESESAPKSGTASPAPDPLDKEVAALDAEMATIVARAGTAATRGERLAVVRDLMWAGLKKYYRETLRPNLWWVIPTVLVAIAGIVALQIVTAGAITAALPQILAIVAGAFLAADLARMAGPMGAYLEKGMAGDRRGAAQAFARGLAVGLLAVLMLAGQAFKVAGKLFARAARATAQGAKIVGKGVVVGARALVKGVLYVGQLAVHASKIAGRIVARTGRFVLERGKLFFKGIESALGRGLKSVKTLYERLAGWFRRFTGFSFEIQGDWIVVYANFNPKIPILRLKRPRSLLALNIPPQGSEEFVTWFDRVSLKDFLKHWHDVGTAKQIGAKEVIERNIRHPGGRHEWLKVNQAPKLKEWGVSMKTIHEARTPTMEMAKKGFPHGSWTLHNQLDELFDSAKTYDDFLIKLNNWADQRLTKGRLDLPPILQR